MNLKVPTHVRRIVGALQKQGFQAYVVGGAVRDAVLRKEPKDWDVATNARPIQIEKIFPKSIPTGKKFGTITVFEKKLPVQITTFRTEGAYQDGRRPSYVRFHTKIEADLSRRDFTINAMAYDPFTKEWVDPFGGLGDLKAHRLRTVGIPTERFKEDALRLVRAGRFIAELSFHPDPRLTAAAKRSSRGLKKISAERIRDELQKTVLASHAGLGLTWLEETGCIKYILPELSKCRGVRQGGWHKYDVFRHTLAATDAGEFQLSLRLGLLLHDIAKPLTRIKDGRGYHFYGHDKLGADLSREALRRLRFPRTVIEDVWILVRHHLFAVESIVKNDAAIRRLIRRVGEARIWDLLALRRADIKGCGPDRKPSPALSELERRIQRIQKEASVLKLSDLAVSGRDIMRWRKIPPGPEVGKILHQLLDFVTEKPKLNTKKHLKSLIQSLDPLT